jgi:hypothetical protein
MGLCDKNPFFTGKQIPISHPGPVDLLFPTVCLKYSPSESNFGDDSAKPFRFSDMTSTNAQEWFLCEF